MMHAARKVDVVVVGAGIGGLAAAADLIEEGYKVAVLEARTEVGGRIRTTRLANGAVLDEGAHWGHTPRINSLTRIVKDEGLERASDDPAIKQHYLGGRLISTKKLAGFLDYVTEALEQKGVTRTQMKHMSLTDAIGATYPMLGMFATKATATYNAAPAGNIGFLEIADDPYGSGGIQLKKGMASLVDAFAEYVGYNNIHTGREVTLINSVNDHVEIRTANGESWNAKRVIYTGSVGTLKKQDGVKFFPPLPQHVKKVLHHLHMGDLCKITFQLDSDFARAHPELAHLRIDEHSPDFPMIGHVMGADEPLLTVIVGTDTAREIENMAPEDVDTLLRAKLAKYPPLQPILPHLLPALPHITYWQLEDHIHGAYSYMAPGMERTGPLPLMNGKVWIAGEAFDKEAPGAIPGAINSCLEAAKDIMWQLEQPKRAQRNSGGHGR